MGLESGITPESAVQTEAAEQLSPETFEKKFAEITSQPDLAELDAADPVRQEMAQEARAKIAAIPEDDKYSGPEGFKNLTDEDLLGHYNTLSPAARQGNPTAKQLQGRYETELQARGVNTSPAQPEQPMQAEPPKKRGLFSIFRKG